MTNRIEGSKAAAPAAGTPTRVAVSGPDEPAPTPAATTLDIRAARSALATLAAGAQPAAPGIPAAEAAGEARSFGSRLLRFFGDTLPATLRTVFLKPLQDLAFGAGQTLAIRSKIAFPTAKAERWRGLSPDPGGLVAARATTARLQAAVEQLDPGTRARVDALRGPFAGSPVVQEALAGLVADGKLARVAAGGGTLLQHLEAIATGTLDKSVESARTDLLGEVIMEAHNSGSVAQRGMNTCGAASAQAHLVYSDPAEYVRLVAGLAAPAGAVKTASGVALQRDDQWDLGCDTQRRTGLQRTISSRLIQPALMDVGAIYGYDNQTDQDRTWVAKMGTKPPGVERQMEAITGKNWDWTATSSAIGRNQVAERIKGASLDHPVIVAMSYNDEGEVMPAFHWIRVVGFDRAKDEVIIRNTQRGTEEHIAYGEFRERMFAAVHER